MKLEQHQSVALPIYILSVFISAFLSNIFTPSPSYFSMKGNIFNVFFVKQGWLWVTILFGGYVYFVVSKKQTQQQQQQVMKGCLRYVLVTLYWYLMTQWLFGPSFIDRIYVATGGGCHPKIMNMNATDELDITTVQHNLLLSQTYQQSTCKRIGGNWDGGHDVSGHCLLLIHSSLFLWEELSWIFYSIPTLTQLKYSQPSAWRSVVSILSLLGLWWWMLIMTSVYFHGHYELFSGTFFGVFGWALLYLGIFPKVPAIGLPARAL